jgi:hypothetical protein
LFDRLLEVLVVQDFESVTVDEEFFVSFDFSVTRLDKAVLARVLSALVPIEAELLDSIHFVSPLLRDDFEESIS